MAEYINTIGQLTPAEMPKAPSNFVLQTVTGETETTINLSWKSNMTEAQFPPTATGQYYQLIQTWSDFLGEWLEEENLYDLTTETWSKTQPLKTLPTRFRIAVGFYDNSKDAFTAWYPTTALIGYWNRIQPLQVTDVAVDTTQGINGWFLTSGSPNSSQTGGMYPRLTMTNPNIGLEFWGKQKTYQNGVLCREHAGMEDNYDFTAGDIPTTAQDGAIATWSFNDTKDVRVDCFNENLLASGIETPITAPSASAVGVFVPSGVTATNITQNSMRINWVNNCPENYSLRLYKDNVQQNPAMYNPTNYKDLTGLNPGTTYTIKLRLLKFGQYMYTPDYQFTTLP